LNPTSKQMKKLSGKSITKCSKRHKPNMIKSMKKQ
jgi:hypothetical protein